MSWRMTPVLVCDGCGTEIDVDHYLSIHPAGQAVLQKNPQIPAERNFCCEACEAWWKAEYPESGQWGPAWEEREWWRQNHPHISIRSAHEEMPLSENHSYFDHPESVKEISAKTD